MHALTLILKGITIIIISYICVVAIGLFIRHIIFLQHNINPKELPVTQAEKLTYRLLLILITIAVIRYFYITR